MSTPPTFILVIYDISDDSTRLDMAAALKRLALTRIQKSAFIGPSRPLLVGEVKNAARRIIDQATDNVQIYPLTQASYNMRIILGKEYSKEFLANAGYMV
ncbi:MAG: CRISPR-associated endonuclease Cas2 [Nitrososphaerota archaeon]